MSTSPYTWQSKQDFVRFLYQLRLSDNRAKLAELRRAASDPTNDIRSIIILGNHLPDPVRFTTAFQTYQLVAVLFAIHSQRFTEDDSSMVPDNGKSYSLGATLRRLRNQLFKDSNGSETNERENGLDKRVKAVLNTRAEDIAIPVRGLIQRIATADEPLSVDFTQLLSDLLSWGQQDAYRRKWSPQQRWAQDYFIGSSSSKDEPIDKQDTENQTNQS